MDAPSTSGSSDSEEESDYVDDPDYNLDSDISETESEITVDNCRKESERAPEKEINLHHAGQVDTLMTTSNSANPDPATAPGTRDTLPLLKSLFELFKQQK
ncbi:hypothetical protein M8J75_001501 [Diaphorina citri]|nr:hypothetical protein M8J75_001501 [Diaphorina citri]